MHNDIYKVVSRKKLSRKIQKLIFERKYVPSSIFSAKNTVAKVLRRIASSKVEWSRKTNKNIVSAV